MFISHLSVFLSFFTLFIFISRLKNQRFYEWLLTFFAFINFLNALVWLLYLYYDSFSAIFIDNYGVLSEVIALVLPVMMLLDLRTERTSKKFIIMSVILVILVLIAIGGQYFLTASKENYLFLNDNPNHANNIRFQLGIDILVILVFARLYLMKQNSRRLELFDGQFKKYFGTVFFVYYFQDILVLLLMLATNLENKFIDALQELGLVLSLFVSIILGIMGIATNYLPLWHKLREFENNQTNPASKSLKPLTFVFDQKEWSGLSPIDWNKIKHHFLSQYPSIIEEIDSNKVLTKTEKSYSFIQRFGLSHKEIANLLSISIRTVETTFYRIRQKQQVK